jgi:hypothetical protein
MIPVRHGRRRQTIVAFDDQMEFEAYIHDANARLRALQSVDRDVDPLDLR